MATSQHSCSALADVLVLTVRKSFWASRECEVFPNRVYTKTFYGYSQNLVNSLFVALKGLVYFYVHRPKLIVFGSAVRIVPWFITLKRIGLLPRVKLVATTQARFKAHQARYVDKIILFSRGELARRDAVLRSRGSFLHRALRRVERVSKRPMFGVIRPCQSYVWRVCSLLRERFHLSPTTSGKYSRQIRVHASAGRW